MAIFGFNKAKNMVQKQVQYDGEKMCTPSEIAVKKIVDESAAFDSYSGGNSSKEPLQRADTERGGGSAIKVLGSGCAKCNQLEEAAKQALAELSMNTTIEHVKDFAQIASYGVMATPALVIDGKVVSYGKVLRKEEIITLLKKARG